MPVTEVVYVDRIKEIEIPINHEVEVIREVEKIVEKYLEVPVVHERVIKVPEIVTQMVVEKIEKPVIVEIEKIV